MRPKNLGMLFAVGALLLGAGASAAIAGANPPAPQNDQSIVNHVRHEILMYPHYSIWDDINFQVTEGHVTLTGDVTQPYKKSDLEHLVQHVSGVTSVTNQLEVLPLSPMDNQLRRQVARAIYADPTLSRYSLGALPSIHVIVDNGHVRLEGVVANQFDKQVAGVRASTVGLSFGPIVNNLRVENPSAKKG